MRSPLVHAVLSSTLLLSFACDGEKRDASAPVETDAPGKSCLDGPLRGEDLLLAGQRHAENVHILQSRQIERKVAPAAPNVEHLHSGLQPELAGQQPQLVALRLLQVSPCSLK